MVRRLQVNPKTAEKYRNGFNVTLHPEELKKPLSWKKPRRIFVCSMGDLFHEDVPFEFINKIITVIGQAGRHTFQILTKRPERMRNFFHGRTIKRNMWLGVTVCNQKEADEKIPVLLQIERENCPVVRFVSIEPMLSPITLTQIHYDGLSEIDALNGTHGVVRRHRGICNKLDWVIVGGETGANARPMDADWARAIRDQCRSAGVPFFFKQMSGRQPVPDDLMVREFPVR